MPRSGFGAGVVAALAAAALSSCGVSTEVPIPAPVLTPVKLETAPTVEAVRGASEATQQATATIKAQAEELERASIAVISANMMAESAYVDGLVAGSKEASNLKNAMLDLSISVDELQEQNEAIASRLKVTTLHLNESLESIYDLEREIGKAEQAINVQTQIAAQNAKAYASAATETHRVSQALATAEGRIKTWRKIAIWETSILVLILIIGAFVVYAKVSIPI